MNNKLMAFTNEELGQVGTVVLKGEPWFVAKDVTDIFDYKNGSRDINRHVDEEDIQNYQNGTLEMSNRGMTIINESGLYSLIMSSKLPQAKQLKRWVTSEVLPTIRKTGAYISNADMMVNTYFGELDDEYKGFIKGLFVNIEKQQKQLQLKDKEI